MCIDEAAAYPSAEPPMAAVCEAICEVSISERSAGTGRLRDLKQSQRRRARAKRSAGRRVRQLVRKNGGTSTNTKVKPGSPRDAPIALITSQSVASGGECAPSVPASSLASRIAARRKGKASREGRRAQVECARHQRGALLPSHRRSGHLLASHRLRTSSRVRDGELFEGRLVFNALWYTCIAIGGGLRP